MLSANGLAAAREEPMAVVTSKDDEEVEVHVGRDILEERLLLEGCGKCHPRGKQMGLVGLGCIHNAAVLGSLHHREEVRAKSIMARRWQISFALPPM